MLQGVTVYRTTFSGEHKMTHCNITPVLVIYPWLMLEARGGQVVFLSLSKVFSYCTQGRGGMVNAYFLQKSANFCTLIEHHNFF